MVFATVPEPWSTPDVGDFDLTTALGACCHGSRLLGREPSFVLHGGGNTSVKVSWADVTGAEVDCLFVKGSGWDLGTIEPAGFAPLRLRRLHELLELDVLTDEQMTLELAAAKLDPRAPAPSVESLLHAFLPFPAVQHSHADVIVAMTNTADGEGVIREALGNDVVIIPYVKPGFDLARMVKARWSDHGGEPTGMVLLNHGLFTFGEDTRAAYERHMELIVRAQRWMNAQPAAAESIVDPLGPVPTRRLTSLRRAVSRVAGRPMIVSRHRDPDVAAFVARPDLDGLATRGPLTPDHVIRTKRVPMIGTDVDRYAADYRRYVARNEARASSPIVSLDPAPRVALDAELGLLAIGATAADAAVSEDIYRHTAHVLAEVEDRLGGYVALDEGEIFDVEYWELEQAKLARAGSPPPLAGEVALVTGAASGIGRACAARLARDGAAVVGLDRDLAVVDLMDAPGFLGMQVDVTDDEAVAEAIDSTVERLGGIDLVVVSAGVFPPSHPVTGHQLESWRSTMAVNVDSVLSLFSRVHPVLCDAPLGGRVVIIGSKNAPAPGRGAAAYSASKAALTQLARVCALEWAADRIRVNTVHPDAVFDTGLWSPEIIESRADAHGLTVEEYRSRNLLGSEVRSDTVAEMVAAMCGPAFAATTGAQIPVDGGSERII